MLKMIFSLECDRISDMKERDGCRPDKVISNLVSTVFGTKKLESKEEGKFSKEAYAMMLKTETSEITPSDEGETVIPTGDTTLGKNGHKRYQTNRS